MTIKDIAKECGCAIGTVETYNLDLNEFINTSKIGKIKMIVRITRIAVLIEVPALRISSFFTIMIQSPLSL